MRATLLLALPLALLLLGPACHRPAAGDAPKTSAPTTPQPFGATCSNDGECQSHACFIGGSNAYCSIVCKPETAATDCPKPQTNGVCNKHGYCKKP
jgi:hypothetical protein